MKRSTLGIIIAVVALIGIGGIVAVNSQNSDDNQQRTTESANAGNGTGTTNDSQQKPDETPLPEGENQINIVDFDYSPKTMTIKKGTTVTWTNQDDARHDITPDEESEFFTASELLAKGETYSFTFNEPGTYAYHCTPHPYMQATIEVTE